MLDKVQLKVQSVSEILGNPEIGIVVLHTVDETMQLAIVCDAVIKQELYMRLSKQKECNTMLPEVMYNILANQVGYNFEILINDVIDGIYRAMIVNTDTLQPISLRAADAILLHLISKNPIYITKQLIQRQGVPVMKGSPVMSLPYNALSDKMLKDALKAAIDDEKYEMASTLRDELKKRGKL